MLALRHSKRHGSDATRHSATKSWSLYKGTIEEPEYAQFSCRDTASAFAAVEPKETDETGKQLYVYCIWMNHVPTKDELSNAR